MKKIMAGAVALLGAVELLFCVFMPFYYSHQFIAVIFFAAMGIIAALLVTVERFEPVYGGMITLLLCIVALVSERYMFVGVLLGVLAAVMMVTLNTKGLPTWVVLVLCAGALWYSIISVLNRFSQYRAAQEAGWYGIPEIAESTSNLAVNSIGFLMVNIGVILSVIALCICRSARREQERKKASAVKPVQQREDDWTCPCGRRNTVYTSTCVCGRSKREAITKKPEARIWKCTCGRENPMYTSTCVCGKNKRDAADHEL